MRDQQQVLLTVQEMYQADRAAMAGGVSGLTLMEAAGCAVARVVREITRPRPVVVLCGPGNNGGDGFVAARLLAANGWPVSLGLLGRREALTGDAAANAVRWRGDVQPLDPALLAGEPLVIDAIFGAGLGRPVDGVAAAAIDQINRRALVCVAVDVPSGVHGDSGAVLGTAPRCRATVTFFRAKPGHFLLPGRELCGRLTVADIGIPAGVLAAIAPSIARNGYETWLECFPVPTIAGNKYGRGHAVILGGGEMTGAARLAAEAARRIGAGLVTIASPTAAQVIYASGQPGTIVTPIADDDAFAAYIGDGRRNALLLGPGAGVSETTRRRVLSALATGRACVLDADALTAFASDPAALFRAIAGPCALTPHDGEYARLFPAEGDRRLRALAAAKASGAVILLKGPDTVVAAPDGRSVINDTAPPDLATAGSGDVLAGMVVGLLAQGMPAFEAAAAAVWMHGMVAQQFGPGLIAEDLVATMPNIIRQVRSAAAQTKEDAGGEAGGGGCEA